MMLGSLSTNALIAAEKCISCIFLISSFISFARCSSSYLEYTTTLNTSLSAANVRSASVAPLGISAPGLPINEKASKGTQPFPSRNFFTELTANKSQSPILGLRSLLAIAFSMFDMNVETFSGVIYLILYEQLQTP